ncbi:MAG: hypothetical protein LBT99_01795 [Bifidobacteriaceae bacterium]|jgi:hypothetical protein|nr:hypothetical protein [Bifidobacteriaceae bacterium]
MEIRKNNIEVRKNWNKFTFKKLGTIFCLFLFGIVTFISGELNFANAASSSTVLPVVKGGTGLNYFPPDQVLMGNGENTLIGKTVSNTVTSGSDNILTSGGAYSKYQNTGTEVTFSMILNSYSSCASWGTIHNNNFTGYMQTNNKILGVATVESTAFKINNNNCYIDDFIDLPSAYRYSQKINAMATLINESTNISYQLYLITSTATSSTSTFIGMLNNYSRIPTGNYRLKIHLSAVIRIA